MNKPITSKRKPKLRVVGSQRTHTRHASLIQGKAVFSQVLEVYTYAEYDALEAWERVGVEFRFLPGIGYWTSRKLHDEDEEDDIIDLARQAQIEERIRFSEG